MRMNTVLPLRVRVATARLCYHGGAIFADDAVIFILVVIGMRPWLPPFF